MLEHGGRISRAAREYGIAREHWIDLSTGVSPYAYPVPTIPAEAWHRLPEDDDGLIEAARRYYGADHLLPVAGSQAAIAALPRLRARSRVAVTAPAYAEHAHAWRQAGHDVVTLPLAELLARAGEFDVVVLISPNNPTGDRLDREAMLALHANLAKHHPVGAASAAIPRQRANPGQAPIVAEAAPTTAQEASWLVVDEAFIDTRPAESLCGDIRPGLIVLRSVGKFFGLAGARVGFVASWPALLDALADALGPWTLTGPARHVVARALVDDVWHAFARERLRNTSHRLADLLRRHGLAPSGGCEFFHYTERADAMALRESLARHAILVRHFDAPQALRFGLPADDAAFARLDRVLAEVLA
jgi:cobalamin biosynthetic protein CobC